MTEKNCTKCGELKLFSKYSNDKSRKDGKFPQCKDCVRKADKIRAPKEKERRIKVAKEWRLANPIQYQENINKWHKKYPGKRNKAVSEWQKRNLSAGTAKRAKYRSQQLKATPFWFEKEKIEFLYKKAREWGFEVDHVIPLQSKNVCGLHCWSNLQLLDATLNKSKGNREYPDH